MSKRKYKQEEVDYWATETLGLVLREHWNLIDMIQDFIANEQYDVATSLCKDLKLNIRGSLKRLKEFRK